MDVEGRPLLSTEDSKPLPQTLTKLIKRLRSLTLALLPVEVDPESINDPTSRVITPRVIDAYKRAAGDFVDALPYCLLRARAEFLWDADHNPADYGENLGRGARSHRPTGG
ncbi:Calcium channel YVC1 [Mycena sanguinolenta]|uniref:Calcium channel YVC1 n=1 Tax=Mycena sanguinolenta TaxID=230812 RepID=A0A8H7D1E0_9AGAR|nr:Calcium channel YVC1 [Mycena sanguinolenta]